MKTKKKPAARLIPKGANNSVPAPEWSQFKDNNFQSDNMHEAIVNQLIVK